MSNMSNGSKILVESILSGSDEGYWDKLNSIKKHVYALWDGRRFMPKYFTLHDYTHCEAVEEAIYKLIPEEKIHCFSHKELFCLISSAWLHDVGMIPDPKLYGAELEYIYTILDPILSNEYPDYRNLFETRDAEIYRTVHHLLSQAYVQLFYKRNLGLGSLSNEAAIIGDLCRYHRKSEDLESMEESFSDGKIKLCAAYLRLADAIQVNRERADENLYVLYKEIGMPNSSELHWLKNSCVRDVTVNNKNSNLIVTIYKNDDGPTKDDLGLLANYILEDIKSELLTVKDILGKWGISYYAEVNDDYAHGVYDELIRLNLNLMICKIKIDGNASASDLCDSIINNILYILNLRREKNKNKFKMILDLQKNIFQDLLERRPNHGLVRYIDLLLKSHVNKDLDTVEEVSKKLNSIKTELESFLVERQARKEKLQEYAKSILDDCGSILLFGNSRLVKESLEGVGSEIKQNTKIYVCEARNIGYYNSLNELVYGDGIEYAKEIKAAKYEKVFLIPDILAANLMSRGKIDKVILGVNGVDLKNKCLEHSAGHLAITNLANIYDIPVYILSDSFKFIDLDLIYDTDLDRNSGSNPWLTGDSKCIKELKEGGIKIINPKYDKLQNSSEFRATIITDVGIINANDIFSSTNLK